MPLVSGKAAKSKKGFSTNVKREMDAGKKQSKAVAIAYSKARGGKKKGMSHVSPKRIAAHAKKKK
jgi:hypothetical protein